jgi:hypothetical protein
MRTFRQLPSPLLFALVFFVASASFARAGDDVRASVAIPAGQPEPIVTANGNPVAQGSYAVGTIRLEYTYVGFMFQPGPFGSFELGLDTVAKNGAATVYPAGLTLSQAGASNVSLAATPSAFTLSGSPWSGTSIVDISIPASVLSDPTLAEDGAVIVGNLQLASSSGSKLGTPTSVQVKIRLVHPTACLKQYTFLSDREVNANIASVVIRYGTRGGNVDKLMNMNPNAGAQVVLLVNTCGDDRAVDLRVAPDSRFVFGPGDGNTTFVYGTAGVLAPGAIDLTTLAAGASYKHVLDVSDVLVAAGRSVLVKVHLVLDPTLDRNTIGSDPFTFASIAFVPDGTFGTLDTETDANPASREVPFSLLPQN